MADERENLPAEEGIEFGSDKKISDFELIDKNTYEFVLERLEPKTSIKNGKTTNYISLTLKIREDVDQDFKGRRMWFTVFERENDPAFNFNVINSIIITQEGRPDYKRHFKNKDEIFQYLIGLHFRADIDVEFNNFKGKDDNIIVKDSFAPSIWDTEHQPGSKNLEAVEVEEDELPF